MSEPRKKKRQPAEKQEMSDLEIAAWLFVGAMIAGSKGLRAEKEREGPR